MFTVQPSTNIAGPLGHWAWLFGPRLKKSLVWPLQGRATSLCPFDSGMTPLQDVNGPENDRVFSLWSNIQTNRRETTSNL